MGGMCGEPHEKNLRLDRPFLPLAFCSLFPQCWFAEWNFMFNLFLSLPLFRPSRVNRSRPLVSKNGKSGEDDIVYFRQVAGALVALGT